MKSLKSNLFSKEEMKEIYGGGVQPPEETNNQSSESGDDECSSSLDVKDTPDCLDVFTKGSGDTVETTVEFDDVCNVSKPLSNISGSYFYF